MKAGILKMYINIANNKMNKKTTRACGNMKVDKQI